MLSSAFKKGQAGSAHQEQLAYAHKQALLHTMNAVQQLNCVCRKGSCLPLTGMSTDLPEPETAAAAPDATPDVKMVPLPVLATRRPPRLPAMAIVPALDGSKEDCECNKMQSRVASWM